MKTLTLEGFNTKQVINLLLSIGMVIVGVYLTRHFYDVHFPTGLIDGETGICSGEGFWNCDKTTTSPLGSVFGVPTSFFGFMIGVFNIIAIIFASKEMEQTNKFVSILNSIGCFILLVYSLVILKGLCPVCFIYYLLSWGHTFLFLKFTQLVARPDIKILVFLALAIALPSIGISLDFQKKMKNQKALSAQYIDQFQSLKIADNHETTNSPYILNQAKTNPSKVKIKIFSDFECPFCSNIAKQIPDVIKGLEDQVEVSYFFYPLDNNCNSKMKRPMHLYACQAAYLSACILDSKKFTEVHDKLFENQKNLNNDFLSKLAKEYNVSECFNNQEKKDEVIRLIEAGNTLGVKSTPTIFINGKKIEGSIPNTHLRAIIQNIL